MLIKKELQWALWVLLSLVVLAADYASGPDIQFPVAFVIPVILSTWFGSMRWGIALAGLLPLVRVFLHSVWWASVPMPIVLINAAIKIVVLGAMAFLAGRAAELAREVRTLRGILPICSNCKKIRSDNGSWRQIEVYISEHTDAEFSHGLCSSCAAELYPGIFRAQDAAQGDDFKL